MPNGNNEPDDDLIDDSNIAPVADDHTPPAPSAPGRRSMDFSSMSDRERELVLAARQEEKRKLYNATERLKKENEDLNRRLREAQNAPIPTTVQGIDQQNEKIDRLMAAIEAQGKQLADMQQNELNRRRESELRAYAAERISEMRASGEGLIEALVGGGDEDEIDESLLIARAEYQRVVQQEEEKRNRAGGRRSSVTVQANNGRPTGTPRPVTPNVVDADDQESISELTSDDAVRSGSYEKNRTKLLSKLKRNFKYQSATQN